jgi:hypothetical protein
MKQMKKSKRASALPLNAERFSAVTVWLCLAFLLVEFFSADGPVVVLDFLLGIVTAVLLVMARKRLYAPRLNVQMLLVTALVLLNGVSCYYAHSGAPALRNLVILFAAWLVYVLVVLISGKRTDGGRTAATAVSFAAAVFSLLSIDAAGHGVLARGFQALGGMFTQDYSLFTGLEVNARITSVLEDPNVLAAVAGLGVLLALGLLDGSEKRERGFHLCCLALNALGFVLVFSLGASGVIVVAFVLLLLVTPRDARLRLFLLMAETLVVTLVGAFVVYAAVFDGTKEFSLVPVLAAVICAAALCALDRFVAPRLERGLSAHPRATLVVPCVLVALLAVYAVAALNVTGAATLSAGETMRRAASLPAGAYTVETDASDMTLQVVSQSQRQLVMHTESVLYEGATPQAEFTVPEDAQIVWFRLTAPSGGTVERLAYSGASEGALKLDYKLLPGFIVNRLQGGFSGNENAVQRTQYWADALKLWQKSPVFGNGLGAMENDLFSVEPFYYETRSAHNYYLQCLVNTGVVGLALFLGVLGASVVLAVRGLKKRRSALLPALTAGLAFTALLALVEVHLESHSYLPMAFVLLALLNVCGTLPEEDAPVVEKTGLQKGTHWAAALVTAAFSVVLFLGFYCNWYVPNGSGSVFDRLDTALKLDPFHRSAYESTYLYYSKDSEDDAVLLRAQQIAEMTAKQSLCTSTNAAAEYYFRVGNVDAAVDTLMNHVTFNRAWSGAWQYAFDLLKQYDDGSEDYRTQVLRVADAMDSWNAESWEPVELTDANHLYLAGLK